MMGQKDEGLACCLIRVDSRSFAVANAFVTAESQTEKRYASRSAGQIDQPGSTPEGRVLFGVQFSVFGFQ